MANTFSTQQLVVRDSTGTASVLSKDSDPAAGVGTPAPLGSLCMRTDTPGAYVKTGAADTSWTALGTMSGFLSPLAFSGSANDVTSGTAPISTLPAYSGDVSSAAGSNTFTIGAGKVTSADLAQVPAISVLGRGAATAGAVGYLTDPNAPIGQSLLVRQSGALTWVPQSYYAVKIAHFTLTGMGGFGDVDNLSIAGDNGELVIFGRITGPVGNLRINGVRGGYPGRILILRSDVPNTSTQNVAEEGVNSDATARFYLFGTGTESIAQHAIMFIYSGALDRWVRIAS